MGNFSFFKNLLVKQDGQSTVEYLLLLLVVTTIAFSIYNSARFKQFLGPDSEFFAIVKTKIEYSYRHGHDANEDSGDLSNHLSFRDRTGKTRFFTTNDRDYGQ